MQQKRSSSYVQSKGADQGGGILTDTVPLISHSSVGNYFRSKCEKMYTQGCRKRKVQVHMKPSPSSAKLSERGGREANLAPGDGELRNAAQGEILVKI